MAIDSGVFKALSEGFAVCYEGGLVPGVSAYKLGAVGSILVSEEAGIRFIEDNLSALERMYGKVHLEKAENAWSLMRKAAGEGLCGLILFGDQSSESTKYMFMNRVEESGNDLPTILAVSDGHDSLKCVTRVTEAELDHASLIHWNRFDLTDPITAKWGVERPFRSWEQGDPFYELKGDNLRLRIAECPLLGDWINIDGAFAIFTSEEDAWHYLHQHAFSGNNLIDVRAQTGMELPDEPPVEQLVPHPIHDLAERISEMTEETPFVSICIDPDGHRENMAYVRDDEIVSVSGRWKILPGNRFEKLEGYSGWNGRDTIGWSAGQSIQLVPLARSFVEISPFISNLNDTHLTDSEAEDWLGLYLDGAETTSVGIVSDESSDLNDYYIVCWDSVNGESGFSPVVIPTFVDALKWLADYETEDDRTYRVSGAFSCSGGMIGFEGTNDEVMETSRGSHFRNGIERLGIKALLHGYEPSDSERLVSLCNTTLRTLHVEFAGYAKDLLWQTNDQQRAHVLETIGLETSDWLEWSDSAEPHVDSRGRSLAIERMGVLSWELLSENGQHFISTVLASLEDTGHIPQRDYAPQSLEIVKALEVELTRIFAAYRDSLLNPVLQFDPDKSEERSLHDYVQGGRAPTLGAMAYILRGISSPGSPLQLSVSSFINELPNAEFLSSNQFTKRTLPRVISKYRNGGVHESPIPYEVCVQCSTDLIGTKDKQGIIAKVLAWQAPI